MHLEIGKRDAELFDSLRLGLPETTMSGNARARAV
jgi:hypothetical protein